MNYSSNYNSFNAEKISKIVQISLNVKLFREIILIYVYKVKVSFLQMDTLPDMLYIVALIYTSKSQTVNVNFISYISRQTLH